MEDMISRKALCEYALNQKDKSITPNDIMRFPSAQPQRTGRWISVFDEDEDKCSECQATFFCASTRFNFCPNCGADMRGKQDG